MRMSPIDLLSQNNACVFAATLLDIGGGKLPFCANIGLT